MWLQILNRTKKLLGITGNEKDEELLYLVENAVLQVQEYIHDSNIMGLEPIIAQYVAHNYITGEGKGSSSSSSTSGITPTLGEVKRRSYPEGLSIDYTTSADFAGKTSSSSSSMSANGPSTYFFNMIVPYLKGRRKVQVIRSNYESIR